MCDFRKACSVTFFGPIPSRSDFLLILGGFKPIYRMALFNIGPELNLEVEAFILKIAATST